MSASSSCVGNRCAATTPPASRWRAPARDAACGRRRSSEREGEPTALIDGWEGVDALWIVDAVSSGSETGTVHRLDASDRALPPDPFRASTHHVSLAETVELARAIGRLPARTIVFGIEGGSFAVGGPLTPAVAAATAAVAEAIREEVAAHEAALLPRVRRR